MKVNGPWIKQYILIAAPEIIHGANAVNQSAIAKIAKIAKIAGIQAPGDGNVWQSRRSW